ncbi:MAG: T9SS type A sorting domain-containing protein, partial [Dysgonamonadaceae bacterium]|nr:T9SS type A sorting domain-containing protein [Dysgonamonadaceae bacterium]
EVIGKKSYTRFELEAGVAGKYSLNCWLIPSMLSDGSYSHYDVLVNGKPVGTITPSKGNWQSIGLDKSAKVSLRAGTNTVSVVATAPEIANVEFVRLSTDAAKAAISSTAYDEYLARAKAKSDEELKRPIFQGDLPVSISDSLVSSSLRATDPSPEGNYFNFTGIQFQYTYYTTVYFYAGEQVYITTNSPVPNFIEFFSVNAPETHSWIGNYTYSSPYYLASVNVTIPTDGYYYVRLRPYYNHTESTATLNINGMYYYPDVPIFSTGFRVTQDNLKVYNTFTAYSTGDPRIWIESGPGIPGRTVYYNDDWTASSDFNWGVNSRVQKQYVNTVYAVLLSSFGSNNPTGQCDIYVKCQNSTITPYFPNLKADDAIQSAPASTVYNSISWSGGITEYSEWPPSPSSDYYVPNNPLASFDLFYLFPRYDGCGIFTRTGATSANSVVDLWATGTSESNYDYTHASVKKGADDYAHGYDWESKPNNYMRTFHPRNALRGDSYGNIVKYYRRIGTGGTNSTACILAEAIADGKAVLENVRFDEDEISLINADIANISTSDVNTFNSLFAAWKSTWASIVFSNPYKFKNSQYNSLLSFCRSVQGSVSLVYEKLNQGEQFAVLPVEDLTLTNNVQNQSLLKSIRESNRQLKRTDSGASIVRSPLSNTIKYVKALLAGRKNAFRSSSGVRGADSGISYSNEDKFNIASNASGISIDFSLDKSARISLSVINLRGEEVASLLQEHTLSAGNHHYSAYLTKGIYLVKHVVDGNVNVKKIVVN